MNNIIKYILCICCLLFCSSCIYIDVDNNKFQQMQEFMSILDKNDINIIDFKKCLILSNNIEIYDSKLIITNGNMHIINYQ